MSDAPKKKPDFLRTPNTQREEWRVETALKECRAIARARRRRERRAREKKLATARIKAYLSGDEHTYLSLIDPKLRKRGAKTSFAVRGQGAVGFGPPKLGERTYPGISPFRDGWRVRLTHGGERLFLGFFVRVDDAERALEHAHVRLGLPPPRYKDPPKRRAPRQLPLGVRVVPHAEQLSLDFEATDRVVSSEGETT